MSRDVYLFHLPAGYGSSGSNFHIGGTHHLPKLIKHWGVLVGESNHNDAMLFELDRRPISEIPFVNGRTWKERREQETDGNTYIKTEWMGTTTWGDSQILEVAKEIWAYELKDGKYDITYADCQTLAEKLLERITGREVRSGISLRKLLYGHESAVTYRQPKPVCSVM